MKKLTAFALAIVRGLGTIGFTKPSEVQAAIPTQDATATGQPYDGVDFDVLFPTGTSGGAKTYNGVYLGDYKHYA